MMKERLAAYHEMRAEQRRKRVDEQLQAMTRRERRLVREAAVMGFVRGSMFGKSVAISRHYKGTAMEEILPEPEFPRDQDIVAEVLSACESFPELYPVITHL